MSEHYQTPRPAMGVPALMTHAGPIEKKSLLEDLPTFERIRDGHWERVRVCPPGIARGVESPRMRVSDDSGNHGFPLIPDAYLRGRHWKPAPPVARERWRHLDRQLRRRGASRRERRKYWKALQNHLVLERLFE